MSDGLFAMHCPRCGAALDVGADGNAWCAGCASAYAPRFGLLVPLDDHTQRPVAIETESVRP